MKKYSFLILGILCLIAGFIWMCIVKKSTGPFLILGGLAGALIVEGIAQLKRNRKN